MNEFVVGQLDESISTLLAGRRPALARDPELCELMQIANLLHYLPRPDFRARLHADLLSAATAPAGNRCTSAPALTGKTGYRPRNACASIIPPLFSAGTGGLPIRASHLAVSFGLHAVALALVAASGWWMIENRTVVGVKVAQLIPGDGSYILPAAPGAARGGGGGGDHDRLSPSHGKAPQFASEQLTSPAVIVRNESPKLPAEPTVIGPPDLQLPRSPQPGDPMAGILAPLSNGTGGGGGMGSESGGGIGAGHGPGIGEGRGGGIGGGVFHVGGGVSAPRAIYDPDPEYSEEARKAKFQGSVMLSAIVGPDGRPCDLRVMRSLGMGLDEKAIDAVRRWRFEAAMKDGHPVAVQINIEVAFRLY
jgi:protein TonB